MSARAQKGGDMAHRGDIAASRCAEHRRGCHPEAGEPIRCVPAHEADAMPSWRPPGFHFMPNAVQRLSLAAAMTTAALAALPAEASGSHARPGGSAGECALFEHGFEFLDAIHWDGFDLDGQLMPGGGNGQPIEWRTSGGYTIKIDRHTITVTDALGRNTVQHWGDPHENLNGKHIKDWGGAPGWDGSRRTLRLGDGSQLTMTATGAHGLVLETSIYDGDQELHLYNATNTIRHHGTNPVGARDGELHDRCRQRRRHLPQRLQRGCRVQPRRLERHARHDRRLRQSEPGERSLRRPAPRPHLSARPPRGSAMLLVPTCRWDPRRGTA